MVADSAVVTSNGTVPSKCCIKIIFNCEYFSKCKHPSMHQEGMNTFLFNILKYFSTICPFLDGSDRCSPLKQRNKGAKEGRSCLRIHKLEF